VQEGKKIYDRNRRNVPRNWKKAKRFHPTLPFSPTYTVVSTFIIRGKQRSAINKCHISKLDSRSKRERERERGEYKRVEIALENRR
jgi:hypothetical protein